MRRIGILVVVAVALAALPANAASPASGVLTKSQRVSTWTGGPFVVSDPVPIDPEELYSPTCREDPLCDHFSVQVTLGEGAVVEIKITTARPNPPGTFAGITSLQPITGDDYDLYVYDPNGVLITGDSGATAKGNERVTITHRKQFDGQSYDVAVRPWAVAPGSTYSGSAAVLTVGR